jgi:ribosomal protein S18 acetylase RimI-like enzyme
MDSIVIDPAGESDIPLLAEYRFLMFAEMFQETDHSGVKAEFVEAARRYYAEKIGGGDEVSLVAKAGGEPVGCGTIMFQKRPPSMKSLDNLFGYILNIYVRPEYRKRGIATAIMKDLEAEAKKRGARRIGLHASRAGANVYKKLGYEMKESYMETDV